MICVAVILASSGWIGFAASFILLSINGIHSYYPTFPSTMMEALALDLVFKLFGFTMPGVDSLEPLNEAFFRETVPGEIDTMVYRTGQIERLRPWVGLHHGGVRISTGELSMLMDAIDASPLQSFIYWHYSDMTEEEWQILQQYIH